mgnify:CR=1 FL=1
MSIKMLLSKDTVYDILNDQNNCEQQLLDFYNAYIMAVSCVSVYTDSGDYKKYYIEELENEIKNRIIIKLPVLRIAVRDKLVMAPYSNNLRRIFELYFLFLSVLM